MSRASARSSPAACLRTLHPVRPMNLGRPLHRVAAACALLLVAAVLGPAGSAAAASSVPTSGELTSACAAKSSGLLRAVTSPSECRSDETRVTVKPARVTVCVQPSGWMRLAARPADCAAPAVTLALPPRSGTAYFCATLPAGTLRNTTIPGSCLDDEVQLEVTPDDAAPAVATTSPTNGATRVATDVSPTVTFSEPVTAASSAFDLTCDNTPIPFTPRGRGGTTVTLDPTGLLPAGAACTVTVFAAGISDVDTLDPPDNPVADRTFTFRTDAAPSLVSSMPDADSAGFVTGSDLVLAFSEPVDVAPGAFTLSCGGTKVPYAVTGSRSAVVQIDPDVDLPQTATCTLSAPASAITDVDTRAAITAPVSITFTTFDAAPSVTATTPSEGATDVATAADVTVTFSEPVTLDPGALTLACAGVPVAMAPPRTTDDTTFTFSPTGALVAGDACTGTIDRTKVDDGDAVDPPDHPYLDHTFSFTVDGPPAVLSTDPSDQATGVLPGRPLTVTFSEPVSVTPDSFALTCDGAAVPVRLGGGDTVVTVTPTGDVPGTATCRLRVVASTVHDKDLGDPPDAMTADVNVGFTTADAAHGAPTDLALRTASVAENLPVGSLVGTFSSTDPDPGDTFTYALVTGAGDTDNGSFTVGGDELRTAAVLDHEAKSSYAIRVRSTDAAGNVLDKALTVTVLDVNEPPTAVTLSASSVPENQPPGTTVGTLGALDPDAGQTHTFAVVSDGCGGTYADGSAGFTVSGSALVTRAPLDFETRSSYSVCVRVTDSGTPAQSFDALLTVTVGDVKEGAPGGVSPTPPATRSPVR